MTDERTPRLERLLEATARKVSGGRLHPLELLQQVQSAAETSLRDGVVANDYFIAFHPADYEQYRPVLPRLRHEIEDLLEELERRRGWRRIGDRNITTEPSDEAGEGRPNVSARFVELRHRDVAPPPGATRRLTRHRNLTLVLDDGTEVTLTHTPFTIGRGPGNDLVLPVLSVSRQHAEISRTADGILIRDLGSRNGLVVRGERVADYLLDDGETVTLGDVNLRLARE